jgi:hypothetical protein
MRALSLRQPWLNAVLYLGKSIENRRWRVGYRGPILLHASMSMTREEYRQAVAFCGHAFLGDEPLFATKTAREHFAHVLERDRLLFGGVVGRATLVDILLPNPSRDPAVYYTHGDNPAWHMPEQFGWILRDVELLPYFPCKGNRGLFTIPDEVLPPAYLRAS